MVLKYMELQGLLGYCWWAETGLSDILTGELELGTIWEDWWLAWAKLLQVEFLTTYLHR